MPLDASAVAKLLHEFSQRTALRGDKPYRARAYSRAAENLLALTMPLEQIVAEDRLREIPGVGAAIADIIAKLHKTGTHAGLPSPDLCCTNRDDHVRLWSISHQIDK